MSVVRKLLTEALELSLSSKCVHNIRHFALVLFWVHVTDWVSDDPGAAEQCRYPVGTARNSTRRHISKKKIWGETFAPNFVIACSNSNSREHYTVFLTRRAKRQDVIIRVMSSTKYYIKIFQIINCYIAMREVRRGRSSWRHCAIDGVFGIFHWHNLSSRTMGPGAESACNRNEYREHFLGRKGGRCVGLTILPPSFCQLSLNLEASTSWKPQGLSRSVQGLLYLFSSLFTPLRTINFSCCSTILQTICSCGLPSRQNPTLASTPHTYTQI